MIERIPQTLAATAILLTLPAGAQEPILFVPFETIPEDVRIVSDPIELQGDVEASGEVESAVGFRFPDGTLQSTAALDGTADESTRSLTANSGIYNNRIADFVPPEPFVEVCFKNGDVFSDIHTVSESTAGGVCVPGDVGWVFERDERTQGAVPWTTARVECLKDGMRLPEYFEWSFVCDNDTQLGASNMTDDWEWASNETAVLRSSTKAGVGAAVLGNGSCIRGGWTWAAVSSESAGTSTFRCVR